MRAATCSRRTTSTSCCTAVTPARSIPAKTPTALRPVRLSSTASGSTIRTAPARWSRPLRAPPPAPPNARSKAFRTSRRRIAERTCPTGFGPVVVDSAIALWLKIEIACKQVFAERRQVDWKVRNVKHGTGQGGHPVFGNRRDVGHRIIAVARVIAGDRGNQRGWRRRRPRGRAGALRPAVDARALPDSRRATRIGRQRQGHLRLLHVEHPQGSDSGRRTLEPDPVLSDALLSRRVFE